MIDIYKKINSLWKKLSSFEETLRQFLTTQLSPNGRRTMLLQTLEFRFTEGDMSEHSSSILQTANNDFYVSALSAHCFVEKTSGGVRVRTSLGKSQLGFFEPVNANSKFNSDFDFEWRLSREMTGKRYTASLDDGFISSDNLFGINNNDLNLSRSIVLNNLDRLSLTVKPTNYKFNTTSYNTDNVYIVCIQIYGYRIIKGVDQ